jgi:hypothetical protein
LISAIHAEIAAGIRRKGAAQTARAECVIRPRDMQSGGLPQWTLNPALGKLRCKF